MPIDTLDDLIAAQDTRQKLWSRQNSVSGQVVGGYTSHWKVAGWPYIGPTPTTASICTNSTVGAMPFAQAATGKQRLAKISALSNTTGCAYELHDRLMHMGGLSGTNTGSQAVNVDLNANLATSNLAARIGLADYSQVEWWLEWFGTTGSTGVTATIGYTDQTDTTRTTTVAIPATTAASRMIRILPATAGAHIRSIQSVTLSATTGTVGNFGVVATRCLGSTFTIVANAHSLTGIPNTELPIVENSACLQALCLTGSITSPLFWFFVDLIEDDGSTATLDTVDDLINAMANSPQKLWHDKDPLTSQVISEFTSNWVQTGFWPQGATAPTAAAILDNTSTGGLNFTNPAAGKRLYLSRVAAQSGAAIAMVLFDRLMHMGGLSGTLTSAQTVNLNLHGNIGNSNLAARIGNTDYSEIMWFLTWYTATGGTGVTATVTYVDQGGTTRTCTVTVPASTAAGRCIPIITQNDNAIIRSITSVQLSATTGTAGNFGVVCMCPRLEVVCPTANREQVHDWLDCQKTRIHDNSCLHWMTMCNSASPPATHSHISLMEG